MLMDFPEPRVPHYRTAGSSPLAVAIMFPHGASLTVVDQIGEQRNAAGGEADRRPRFSTLSEGSPPDRLSAADGPSAVSIYRVRRPPWAASG
jgi:hypothetical protein